MGTRSMKPKKPRTRKPRAAPPNNSVSYARLVVGSSNFAGKELALVSSDLTIGRTDENDLVLTHPSISRQHARITREHETSHHTISDLKSTNGVRVNGRPYGKVELRAGDCVDLGHVRLWFVEAGRDFVFERDVVITVVPATRSKKTSRARKRRSK